MPLARISLTLSHHSSISLGRSSMLHPVSVQSCCWWVLADRLTFAGPYSSTLLMSSPLLFQQCPACLARLIWMVFERSGRCPYSCCFIGCYLQNLSNTARSILVQLPSRFLSVPFVSVQVVHLYSNIHTAAAWKKNWALFYLIGLTSIWLIVYRWLSMPSLVACWYHFR